MLALSSETKRDMAEAVVVVIKNARLAISGVDISAVDRSMIHDVCVTMEGKDSVQMITIQHKAEFHPDGPHLMFEVCVDHAESSLFAADSSTKYLIARLKRPIHPIIVNGKGMESPQHSSDTDIIRTWCSMPFRTMSASTILTITFSEATVEFEQLQAFFHQQTQLSQQASTASTGTPNSKDRWNQWTEETLSALETEPPMWLDLRTTSVPKARGQRIAQKYSITSRNNSGAANSTHSVKTGNKHVSKLKQHPAKRSEDDGGSQVRKWSNHAADAVHRPEGAISEISKEDFWHDERKKTRWINKPRPALGGIRSQSQLPLSVPNAAVSYQATPTAVQEQKFMPASSLQAERLAMWNSQALIRGNMGHERNTSNRYDPVLEADSAEHPTIEESPPPRAAIATGSPVKLGVTREVRTSRVMEARRPKLSGGAKFDSA